MVTSTGPGRPAGTVAFSIPGPDVEDHLHTVGRRRPPDGGASAVGIMTLILPARDGAALPALSQVLDFVR